MENSYVIKPRFSSLTGKIIADLQGTVSPLSSWLKSKWLWISCNLFPAAEALFFNQPNVHSDIFYPLLAAAKTSFTDSLTTSQVSAFNHQLNVLGLQVFCWSISYYYCLVIISAVTQSTIKYPVHAVPRFWLGTSLSFCDNTLKWALGRVKSYLYLRQMWDLRNRLQSLLSHIWL